MKNFSIGIYALFVTACFGQTMPDSALYLGQMPPGNIPKIFNLSVSPGLFAAERVTISNDGKEIYYSEVKKYYPISGIRIKSYSYSGDKWSGPFNIFEGFYGSAFSVTGDTIYFENENVETFFSIKNGLGWSDPKRIFANLSTAHYLQVTNNGNYYVSSIPKTGIGGADWCRLAINGTDTNAVSLGLPLNSGGDDQDFFVSRDEQFMIVAKGGLKISFHKNDGSWTYPRSLGATINFGLGAWGPYVSPDSRYLFYTTGTKADYSDTYVYWVRIDGLIDSLKHSNFAPYLKSLISIQRGTVGNLFTFQIPDSIFIDDDGNNTLTFSAKLNNGNALPSWLLFNSTTRTFSGIPPSVDAFNIEVTATDNANASVSCLFRLSITNPTGVEENKEQLPESTNLYQNYPNPFNPTTTIEFAIPKIGRYTLGLYNALGQLVKVISNKEYEAGYYKEVINATGLSSGMYLCRLIGDNVSIVRKMILLR